jgi:methylthioribulose-1-phosphate dehydratase
VFDVIRFADAAHAIVEAGQFLYNQGWSPATSSNYSARIDEDHLAITVSGKHKGKLAARDVMVVDLQGRPVQSVVPGIPGCRCGTSYALGESNGT